MYCLRRGNRALAAMHAWRVACLWRLPVILSAFAVFCLPMSLHAMTAKEILDQVLKQNFSESFRVALTIKTFKGKKMVSDASLWAMGRTEQHRATFFVDFEEPKESKGLRFLFQTEMGKEMHAYMYLPVTGKTVPLGLEDTTVDVGGTGLTVEDLQGFISRPGEKESLLREETFDGRDCYVIGIDLVDGKGQRQLWVSKDDFLILKSQQMDANGKVARIFRVTEFFKTEQGKQFPREEEITVPAKGIRIVVRQEHAVFGIEIPEEVMDPEKFGTFQWKKVTL